MTTNPLSVLAIRATHAVNVAESLRAEVQNVLRTMPREAFLSPEGDHLELSWAVGSLRAAERSLLTARQFLRAVADRQPVKPLTPAEHAAECEGRA